MPILCEKCMSFYANSLYGKYCSKCYKETNPEINEKKKLNPLKKQALEEKEKREKELK